MLIRLGFEITFDVPAPAPMLLVLSTHHDHDHQIVRPGKLEIEPKVPIHEYIDGFGNRCGRIIAPAGGITLWDDAVVEVDGLTDPVVADAIQHRVEDLPDDVLVYLLGSRYCEVDRLSDIAWNLFGNAPQGWGRVDAICKWAFENVEFGYQYARSTKTAYDVYVERQGVCRDFNHLALTFCRCMNIPARYATGYLGDIGIPLSPNPMDFSGWFEAYLGGRWHSFDARNYIPRIGRLVMARGRDAVDVALTTSFGSTWLKKFVVWTDEVGPEALSWPKAIKPS